MEFKTKGTLLAEDLKLILNAETFETLPKEYVDALKNDQIWDTRFFNMSDVFHIHDRLERLKVLAVCIYCSQNYVGVAFMDFPFSEYKVCLRDILSEIISNNKALKDMVYPTENQICSVFYRNILHDISSIYSGTVPCDIGMMLHFFDLSELEGWLEYIAQEQGIEF